MLMASAHRLHRGGQSSVGTGELLESEPRSLDDDVVERRLEASRGFLGDVVDDLVERVADGKLGRHLRDRVTGRLRRQSRRAGDTRVHLDDDQAAVLRVHRELDVAAAGVDAHLTQNVDGKVAHRLVLAVGQRHRRGDGDRVSGVDTDRVDVLDGADDHDVVATVAHELEFVFLPAEDGFLDQDVRRRRRGQTATGDAVEIVDVVRHAGTEAAHGEGRTHDNRVTEFGDRGVYFVHRVANCGLRGFATDLGDDVLELLAILAALYGVEVGADQFDVVLLEDALLVQRHCGVERSLTAERREDGVDLVALQGFLGDDLLEELGRDRLDVRGVGELGGPS